MYDDAATRSPDTGRDGLLLGRYAPTGVCERDPLGDTNRAHDLHHGGTVRIRRVYAQQDREHAEAARHARERMAHEHRVAGLFAELPPGFLRVHEFATAPDGTALLVIEDAPGGTLRERLAAGDRLPDAALAIAVDIAAALAAAHERGVIHRNLKPANIWFGADGRVRVADFSLAQVDGDHPTGWQHPGTPLYLSPEQETTTRPLTPASDQYALGLVLFEMLTGAKYRRLAPGRATDMLAALPADMHRLVTRMLAPEPASRFPSLGAVVAEIAQMRGGNVVPGLTAKEAIPGKMSNVSHMSEPVPANAAHPAPPLPEMEPGQGTLHRLTEPIPDDVNTPRIPRRGLAPEQADDMERLGGPMPDVGRTPEPAAPARPPFGPRRGLLVPVAGAFAATHAGITLRDGTVSARFLNPGDAVNTQWTVGFAFRETPGVAYYLCGINARGEWFVTVGRHDAANDAAPWETGTSDAIQTAEDGINILGLTLAGDTARLVVNGIAVATVNLASFAPFVASAATVQGDVAIAAQCANAGADGETSVLYDHWTVTPAQ